MSVLGGNDGELRIIEFGKSGVTHHIQILFSEMNFTAPIARAHSIETLIMDRGMFSSDAHMINGNDVPRYSPIDISFNCRVADITNTQYLNDWLSGVTSSFVASHYSEGNLITEAGDDLITEASDNLLWEDSFELYSFKAKSDGIDDNTLPEFKDVKKSAYRVETLWENNLGYGFRYDEVYFPVEKQLISESKDTITFNCSGRCYGPITRITSFTSGTTNLM